MESSKALSMGKEPVKSKGKLSEYLYIPYRLLVIIQFVILFLPSISPARVSGLIKRSTSLLTSGFMYSALIENMGRPLKKEWILESSVKLLHYSSLIICIGILLCVAGACFSMGKHKCKVIANLLGTFGSLISLISMIGIYQAYLQVVSQANLTDHVDKVEPMFPESFMPIAVLFLLMFIVSVAELVLNGWFVKGEKLEMEMQYKLFLMFLPFLILAFVFSYLPLWGWRYAFFDYSAGDTLSMDNFVGLKWFKQLVSNAQTVKDMGRVMKNTLAMSFLGIATSWLPMAFAIFLSEIKSPRFRRFVQTFTTIPNFISWVLVFAIAFAIFSTDGFVSSLLMNLGIWQSGKNFLMNGSHTWLKMWAWGTWKGVGWSAIIYIAGISGIDQQLYEAATVDGAGRFQKMWHVTLPGLLPTFSVLLLMSIAGILSNGMEQYLVFENTANTNSIMVLDLYVYQMGIVKGIIPLSTVVGMLKSIVSVTLLFIANKVSKMIRGESII